MHALKEQLIAFEADIKAIWEAGELPCLTHLCGGNEEQLIEIFKGMRAGDWVFFITNKGGTSSINHAGIVTELKSPKEIYFIHASSSKGIREDNLISKYWMSCFAKAKRPF